MPDDKNKPFGRIKGRGSDYNPTGRFERLSRESDEDERERLRSIGEDAPLVRTELFKDSTRSIVTENDSPDIGFTYSINSYRGCEHGCAYCYARPTHEYLGLSAGLDFETKIFVKQDAATLLREKLMKPSWKPEPIFLSGITDCYQPIEREMKVTRSCLEVLAEFKNPFGLITKNKLITRDIDIIAPMAKLQAALVFISVTTLDEKLGAELEPRTSRPQARLEAIRELAEAGIPVGVNIAPVIPGLTDHEMPAILKAAAEAGATMAGMTPLRLPWNVLPIFSDWLERHRPERKEKVLGLIRDIRGGKMNDSNFGSRMKGEGPVAENLSQMFKIYSRREGLNEKDFELSTAHFSRPGDQLSLL
jgi:DNA repair photolyase